MLGRQAKLRTFYSHLARAFLAVEQFLFESWSSLSITSLRSDVRLSYELDLWHFRTFDQASSWLLFLFWQPSQIAFMFSRFSRRCLLESLNKSFLTLVVGELIRLSALRRLVRNWEFGELHHLLLFQISIVFLVFLRGICRVVNAEVTIALNSCLPRPRSAHRWYAYSVMRLVYGWVNRLYVICDILARSNVLPGSLLKHLGNLLV
jgi:hypothetical protein